MQRLLDHAVWEHWQAMEIVRELVNEHLGDPGADDRRAADVGFGSAAGLWHSWHRHTLSRFQRGAG
jgi:hypothetical protein